MCPGALGQARCLPREGDMRVRTAAELLPGHRIFFGDAIVRVIAAERPALESIKNPADDLVTLVTEDDDRGQWIDYVSPGRKFASEF